MKVLVSFEFPDIREVNSRTVDRIVDMFNELTQEWQNDMEGCYVYIDDVITEVVNE